VYSEESAVALRTKGLFHQALSSGLDRMESTSQEYDKGRYDTYADSKSDRNVGDRVSIMNGTR
jgi:hypothetical protein